MSENPLGENIERMEYRLEDVFYRLGNDLFDLDSTVETILSSMEEDVNSAVDSGRIPAGTGEIIVRINKKENGDYNLLVQSNGSGLTRDEFKAVATNIGRSRGNNNLQGFWPIAPFQLCPNRYIIQSNPRKSDDSFTALADQSKFEFSDNSSHKFFGLRMELEVEDTDYTVPEIGRKFRQVARRNVDVQVRYELCENGTVRKQEYLNVNQH